MASPSRPQKLSQFVCAKKASKTSAWPNAEVPPCPLSRRYQGYTDIKRALTRGTPIYEYTP